VRPGIKAIRVATPAPLPVDLAALASPGRSLDAMLSEEPQRPALASPETDASALPAPAPSQASQASQTVPEQARLEGARQMARENPIAVANIVKSWVNGDAAAA
jgi:flagellar M-ring protein FliF